MEGLVKGLINVALDHIQGGDDRDDRDERSRPVQAQDDRDERDERSRSSWAQVVSGDGEDNDGSRSNTNCNNTTKPWDSRQEQTQQSYGRHEQKSKESPRSEEDKNNDGWETVQKKPSKQKNKVHKEQWSNYKRPLSEQHYSNEVDCGADIEPSECELSDLSEALNRLWELDLNRLVPGKDYEIDCGEGKKVYQKDDMAAGSLFSWLNEEIFTRPTYSRFCSLLDNYNPHEGYKEVVTPQEKQEEAAFIEEISRTAPVKYLYKYLLAKGIVSGSYDDFKRTMTSIWFDLYGRGGTSSCSSAFEHVFVGEIKREQQVSGFHNWIQFYLEESKGKVDYQGYIFPRRRGEIPDSETQLLTIQFEWNGVLKSVSSTLIGVSPEFEMAIYTLCYYVGGEDNHVQLGPYPVNIKCYRLGNKIGSAFPVADS
ncbi:hypothetical protein CASFOL_036993 [Castilleja foliolosa]|uniref:EndoU domain-containing protein n=1 Tax=Castilleja foliolosa TaxID=1961234 RepID=A0ABD3BPJ1_9LAMI